jgi:hypothetical protein
MPDITFGLNINVNKGFLNSQINVSNVTATMTQEGMQSLTYSLTTNPLSIATANLSSVGMAFLRNLSTATAATAQIGIDAGGSFAGLATLRPGEPALFRMSQGTEYKAIGVPGARLRVDITEG